MATLEERKELAAKKLEQYGQTHVLKYYDTLTEEEKDKLLTQIEQTDLSVTKYVHHREELPGRGEITPNITPSDWSRFVQERWLRFCLPAEWEQDWDLTIRNACMTLVLRILFISCRDLLRI